MTNSISRNGELYILRKDSGATGSSYQMLKTVPGLKFPKKYKLSIAWTDVFNGRNDLKMKILKCSVLKIQLNKIE